MSAHPGIIIAEQDPQRLLCRHRSGPIGPLVVCPEPAEFVEIHQEDWSTAFLRCAAHADNTPESFYRVPLAQASEVQLTMIAAKLLAQQEHYAGGGEDGTLNDQGSQDYPALSMVIQRLRNKLAELITIPR